EGLQKVAHAALGQRMIVDEQHADRARLVDRLHHMGSPSRIGLPTSRMLCASAAAPRHVMLICVPAPGAPPIWSVAPIVAARSWILTSPSRPGATRAGSKPQPSSATRSVIVPRQS